MAEEDLFLTTWIETLQEIADVHEGVKTPNVLKHDLCRVEEEL